MKVLFVVVVSAVAPLVPIATSPAEAVVAPRERVCVAAAVGQPGDLAVVNITPLGAAAPGNGQLLSSDVGEPPRASNVNFAPGTVDPNVGVAPIGADGRVCYVNSENASVDVVLDQLAAIRADAYTPTQSRAPERAVDTRILIGRKPLGPSEAHCFEASLQPGALAFVNLLPLNATAPGNGALASGVTTTRPTASNVNFARGTIDPNLAVAATNPDGQVCYINSEHASLDLVADVLLSIKPTAYTPTVTGQPTRLVDTRSGLGGGRIEPSEIRCFSSGGTPGDLAIVNLLPLNAVTHGFGALGGGAISNVNVAPNSVDPNLAFSTIDAQGRLCYMNSEHGAVDLVADLLATIKASATVTPPAGVSLPRRLIDTRPAPDPTRSCPTATRCYRVDGDDAVSISNDGGRTWTDVRTSARQLTSVSCATVDRCWATDTFVFRDLAEYITLDGGRTWTTTAFELSLWDLECPVSGVCIAVGAAVGAAFSTSRAAAITRDRGATWSFLAPPAQAPDPIGTRLEALSCGPTSCRAQSVRSDTPARTNVSFTTADGWANVTVTEQ